MVQFLMIFIIMNQAHNRPVDNSQVGLPRLTDNLLESICLSMLLL